MSGKLPEGARGYNGRVWGSLPPLPHPGAAGARLLCAATPEPVRGYVSARLLEF